MRTRSILSFGLVAAAVAVAALWSPPPRAAEAAGCRVQGRVLDAHGDPVPGIQVRLAYDREVRNGATGFDGRYDFGEIASGVQRISVELFSSEYAHSPRRFEVLASQQLPRLRSDVFSPSDRAGCARDFAMAELPSNYRSSGLEVERWPDVIEIYQGMRRAWALADALDIEVAYGLPIRVYAWCDDRDLGCRPDADFAGFAGTRSDGSYVTTKPYIALGEPTSEMTSGDSPDNREYHEFGHYFHASLFSEALPLHPSNEPHGGYYRNPSSSDSFVEGFAEFYSLMVSKHVDGEPSPERYRIRGAEYDVELDHLAWEWAGWWEELALAGVLLDFEDGDADYRQRSPAGLLHVESYRVRTVDGGRAVDGTIVNTGSRALAYPEVVVELLDRSGSAVARLAGPATVRELAPGESARFLVPLPQGVAYAELEVTPGPLPGSDDDPIDLTLSQLFDAIVEYEGSHRYGNGHVFDVAELHDALAEAFGGRDRDRDGVDDVEQIFRAHGFFADLDGSRSWGRGESPGLTSHPEFEGYPELLPRSDLPAPAEATVKIESGGVATHAMVYVTYAPPHSSRSYGYVATLDAASEVLIAAPPRSYEAEITVMLLADGFEPAVVARFETEELWDYWDEAPGESIIEIEAELRPEDRSSATEDLAPPLASIDASSDSELPLPPAWAWIVAVEVLVVAGFATWVLVAQARR